MLEVVMEDPVFREGNRESLTDGFAPPKQTILNFFKPQSLKPTSENKPKDLFAYFAKSSNSLGSPMKPDLASELKSDRQKENRKRKKCTEISNSPENISSLKKRSKASPKSASHRNSVCENPEEDQQLCKGHLNFAENKLLCENKDEKASDDEVEEVCFNDYISNVCTLKQGSETICANDSENKFGVANGEAIRGESVTELLSSDESSPPCQTSENNLNKAISKTSKNEPQIQNGDLESSKMCQASKNTILNKKSKKGKKCEKEKQTETQNCFESAGDEALLEMSFHDYMQALDEKTTSDVKENEQKPDSDSEIEKQHTKNTDITNFFQKVNKSPESTTNNDVETVTICADIHPEPISLTPDFSKKEKGIVHVTPDDILRKRISKTDDEIVILSTEFIDVEDSEKKNRKVSKPKSANKVKNSLKVDMKNPKKGGARRSLNLKKKIDESINPENEDILNISDIDNGTESFSDKEKDKEFLKSGTSVIPSKTKQSTLTFGAKTAQNVTKSVHCTRVRDSASRKNTLSEPVSESTPLKASKIKKGNKNKDVVVNKVGDCEKSSIDADTSGTSRIKEKSKKKQKYEVTFLDADDKKKTPIRMKLRRCNLSSSASDAEFTPKSEKSRPNKPAAKHQTARLSTAKKLLVKAKSGKVKTSKKPVELKETAVKQEKRRSQRKKDQSSPNVEILDNDNSKLTNQVNKKCKANSKSSKNSKSGKIVKRRSSPEKLNVSDDVVIIEESTQTKIQSKEKGRKTPLKGKRNVEDASKPLSKSVKEETKKASQASTCKSKTRTVKQPDNVKIAPIFSQNVNSGKPQTEKKIIDPEKEKIRQAFLMSGVPDQLKRQSANVTLTVEADYPPIPKVNHVQQKQDYHQTAKLDIWNLPAVSLPLNNISFEVEKWKCSNVGGLIDGSSESSCKVFQKPQPLAKAVLDCLLEEIDVHSSVYPVKSMYKTLAEKKLQAENEKCSFFGLLSENQPKHSEENAVIVDNSSTCKKEQKSGHRNLRKKRSSTEKDVQMISENLLPKVDAKEDMPICSDAQSLMWTEKYQPSYANEILGNENNIKRLRSWLLEWKHRFNKEAQKMKRILMKQSKNKEKDEGNWLEEDSDFDVGSSDSEEEDGLCNTVLLTGSHGIGKTASVYTLSNELGFKVFEVNASSCRNGKKILSQLQEATQSLRVAHDKSSTASCSGMSSPFGKTKNPEPAEKKLPTAFANLFKKANSDSKEDTKPKTDTKGDTKRKKRKRDEKEDETCKKKRKLKDCKEEKSRPAFLLDEDSSASSKGLNLTSTSLILFDEVDLVFEEDKGFWSAVQSFMASTKIPIILTASDPSFSSSFEGRYEQYSFKTPSLTQIACHLQLISLIENVRVDSKEISDLVKLYKGDIRRSLLSLQYWVESGGGISQKHRPVSKPTKVVPVEFDENLTCSQHSVTCEKTSSVDPYLNLNESSDFVVLKPGRRKARVLMDDDSSNSMVALPPVAETSVTASAGATYSLHGLCTGSLIGSTNFMKQPLMEYLSNISTHREAALSNVADACSTYRHRNCNIPYSLHLSLLPFDKISNICWKKSLSSMVIKPKKKRQRIKSDLYDSEESNEAQTTLGNEENEETSTAPNPGTRDPVKPEENNLLKKSILEFSNFYDTMSANDFMNSKIHKNEIDVSCYGDERRLKDSVTDSKMDREVDNWWLHSMQRQLESEVEVRALHRLCCELGDVNNCMKSDKQAPSENFTLPLDQGIDNSQLTRQDAQRLIRCRPVLSKAQKNIMSCLPLWSRPLIGSVAMDYMPVLRAVSRAEQSRKDAKLKRRFHHYFDNIGLNLKKSTVDVLQSSFDT